ARERFSVMASSSRVVADRAGVVTGEPPSALLLVCCRVRSAARGDGPDPGWRWSARGCYDPANWDVGESSMARIEAVEIPASHGLLEGLLRFEEESPPPSAVAVVCHPHPLGGGTMHNKVVFTIARALNDAGIPALRFNFRGVGRSTGSYDNGRGEADDLRT